MRRRKMKTALFIQILFALIHDKRYSGKSQFPGRTFSEYQRRRMTDDGAVLAKTFQETCATIITLQLEAEMRRHILITGGTRGIGEKAVEVFARAGDTVSFFYKTSHDRAKQIETNLSGEGFVAEGLCVDVTDQEAVKEAIIRLSNRHGDIDVLVSNAGIADQRLITDVSDTDFHRMMDTHVTALFYLTQNILPAMIRKKQGVILAISSIWGITGASCEVAYSAAKAAVIGYIKALAKEVGPSGIRANCLAPGIIETDMLAGLSGLDKTCLAEETPLRRLGTPEDVANLLFFLSSEKASFITGQVISPNGGFVI